jgi:hypothetical protein
VLMVPGIGSHAEDPRIARLAARGKGSSVEPVNGPFQALYLEAANSPPATVR